MDELESFGDLLIRLRGKMSLREAALKIGISHSYLMLLEKGRRTKPSKETLTQISKVYDYPQTNLMLKAGYTALPTKEELIEKLEHSYEWITLEGYFKASLMGEIETVCSNYEEHFPKPFRRIPDSFKDLLTSSGDVIEQWQYDMVNDFSDLATGEEFFQKSHPKARRNENKRSKMN